MNNEGSSLGKLVEVPVSSGSTYNTSNWVNQMLRNKTLGNQAGRSWLARDVASRQAAPPSPPLGHKQSKLPSQAQGMWSKSYRHQLSAELLPQGQA